MDVVKADTLKWLSQRPIEVVVDDGDDEEYDSVMDEGTDDE